MKLVQAFFYATLLCLASLQASSPSASIELCSPQYGNGMFSVFTMVVGLLHQYDTSSHISGIKVDFKDQGVYYDADHGLNWWEYYFEPIDLGYVGSSHHVTTSEELCHLAGVCEFHLSRTRVNELIQKYVHLKPRIKKKIEGFQRKKFGEAFVIGVHFRGTDKISEAPRVAFESVKEEISRVINSHSHSEVKIFVATDEQAFLDYIVAEFPQVIFRKGNIRSKNGLNVHHHSPQNYKKGEEALIDCLLLSKCDVLIRTSSNLSLVSSYFNAELPVINLNARYGY